MPTFAYTAIDLDGAKSRGTLVATDAAAVGRELDSRGFFLLDVAPTDRGESRRFTKRDRFRRRDLVEATRALASLLGAGLPLSRALQAASGVASGGVAMSLTDVRERVERGADVHAAMREHPRVFPPLYVGLVRAGDRSGDLQGAFARLADHLEREGELRSRITSALIYPLLLAGVGAIAIVILLLLVIPRFADLLLDAGAPLPASTSFMLSVSVLLQEQWLALAIVSAGMLSALVAFVRSATGRNVVARTRLGLPLVGRLERNALAAQFARLTGSLVAGGAPLLGALDDTVDSTWNPAMRRATEEVRERVRAGASLKLALANEPLFPPLLTDLVGVGEESGALDDFLLKAAEIFENRTQRALERLVTIVEPAMIIVFGVVVGLIAFSLLQAIYGVNAGAFR